MEHPQEYKTRYGRTVKVTAKLHDYIQSQKDGAAAKVRAGLLRTLNAIDQETSNPSSEQRYIEDLYKSATEDHAQLLDLEATEMNDLDEQDHPMYKNCFEDEATEIQQVSQKIEEFLAQEQVKPTDSISRTSRGSKRSRRSQARDDELLGEMKKQVELEAKRAALLRSAELEEEKKQLEMRQKELERKGELIALEAEIQASKARVDILEAVSEMSASRVSSRLSKPRDNRVLGHPSGSRSDRERPLHSGPAERPAVDVEEGYIPPRHSSTPHDVVSGVLDRMAHALERSQRNTLQIEPEVFKGETLEFRKWRQSFEELIENDVKPERRLLYLTRYTAGAAKDCISSLSSLQSSEAYKEAMDLLEERYGDPFCSYEAYMKKLEDWPAIKVHDALGLRKYADFLSSCITAMSQIPLLQVLDDPNENIRLAKKLPRSLAGEWGQKVDKWMHKERRTRGKDYPPFFMFADFVQTKARIECGPVQRAICERLDSKFTRPDSTRFTRQDSKFSRPARALLTDSTEDETVQCNYTSTSGSEARDKCLKCSAAHSLSECYKFKALSMDERYQFAREVKLCRSCLMVGHMARACIQGQSCTICKKRHHVLFHDDNYQPRPRRPFETSKPVHDSQANPTGNKPKHSTITNYTSLEFQEESALIVPVYLSKEQNPEVKRIVYAVLDSQADSCFVSKSVLSELGVKGTEVSLQLRTMAGTETIESEKISNLMVSSLDGDTQVKLQRLYSRDVIAADHAQIPDPRMVRKWKHLQIIADEMHPVMKNVPIGLLIGRHHARILKPLDCIPGEADDPYALRTSVGWGVIGNLSKHRSERRDQAWAFRTTVKELKPQQIVSMFALDFNECLTEEKVSVEDRSFMKQLDESVRFDNDGHVLLPLPMKKRVVLPDNKRQAAALALKLRERLLKDERYRKHYETFMENLLEQGYAEKVDEDMPAERKWYLPHHGVYHPKKPDKLRVVFNCSIEHRGEVLNRHLLQGPDFMNNLVGVLCRFRRKQVALTCDIEAMFHQVRVREEDRDYLRFLWWPQSDLSAPLEVYRMTVHLFGATSSPGCANYALRHVAKQYKDEFSEVTSQFIERDFYVDDGLSCLDTEKEASTLAQESRELCKRGGFRLHKFLSNKKIVLETIPVEDRSKELQQMDLSRDKLPTERTLGILWGPEADIFQFKVDLPQKAETRRGILATVSSVYDPIGLVSPFILQGKRILQDICQSCKDWDEPIPEDIRTRWSKWKLEAPNLAKIKIRRCYTPESLGTIKKIELHHFSDASVVGYGQCSYLRVIDKEGEIATSLVIAKSRVTPVKQVTIPRLELQAAVTSARVAAFLDKELQMKDIEHHFWTDSQVVIGYLRNETKRFHVFVANRVQVIRDLTDIHNWHYVDTKVNPADLASRGASPDELEMNPMWLQGPEFLRQTENLAYTDPPELSPEDPELKKSTVLNSTIKMCETNFLLERLTRFSQWKSILRAVAVLTRLKNRLKKRLAKKGSPHVREYIPASTTELDEAEMVVLKMMQDKDYADDIDELRKKASQSMTTKSTRFKKLDAFIDDREMLRVGGRLKRSSLPFQEKHPLIVHGKNELTPILVQHHHVKTLHSGREATVHSLRCNGIWLTSVRHVVDSHIWKCVHCKRYRGKVEGQKMSELPEERLEPSPMFSKVGVDFFGPYMIKQARSKVKRYGALFTCLASRAVHVEIVPSLSSSDFLNAYRRFSARRGPAKEIWCDRGTNFVGTCNELRREVEQMMNQNTALKLRDLQCDLVSFQFNPPHASHMGGVWERQIRSIRSALTSLLDEHYHLLDDDLLQTLMCEAEAIVNSRPLTPVDASGAGAITSLSPALLLTMKPKTAPPLPGSFSRTDLYSKARWRRVQHLADEFWKRWRREFLPTLQPRQKWQRQRRQVQVDDVVLMVDENEPRASWKMGRVTSTTKSKDDLVRKVTIKVNDSMYERPVQKLIVIIPREIPVEEP